MDKKISDNFSTLVGTLSAGEYKSGKFAEQCGEMKALGYYGIYFNDIFFEMVSPDAADDRDVIFREDDTVLVYREEQELLGIKNTAKETGLCIPASHFLQTLPPPGKPPEWIFPVHKRLLEITALMGMKNVTTHIGWNFGAANREYMGDYAVGFRSGRIDSKTLFNEVHKRYGADRLYSDSVEIYKNLCGEAGKHGVSVTVETACSEYPEITFNVEKLVQFIRDSGTDNLGICVDSGHCHFNGLDVADVIKKTGAFFTETHFHDNFADRDRHNPVGIGTINWLKAIEAMQKVNYSHPVTFEQGDYRTNTNNWSLFLKEAVKS